MEVQVLSSAPLGLEKNIMQQVKDSVVLVTGANRGLGQALVDELFAGGAQKVYATTRKPCDFDDARVVNIVLDVRDMAAIGKLSDQMPDVNIVINNAGAFFYESLTEASLDHIHELFEANVFGPIRIIQTLAPILKKNGGGIVVNMLAVTSWIPNGPYGPTKAALWSVTNTFRTELADQGTRLVGVHCGPIDTEAIEGMDIKKELINEPKDIARAMVSGINRGDVEIIVDEFSRHIKTLLSGPVEQLANPV